MKKQSIRHSSFCLVLLDGHKISTTFLNKALTIADLLSDDIYFATIFDHPLSHLPLLQKYTHRQKHYDALTKYTRQTINDTCRKLNISKTPHHYQIFWGPDGIHQLNQICIDKQVTLLFKDLHPPLSFTQQLTTVSSLQLARELSVSTWFIAQPEPVNNGLACINGEQHDISHELITHRVVEIGCWLSDRLSLELELFHAITPLAEEWQFDTDLTRSHQTTTQQLEMHFDERVIHLQKMLPNVPITSRQGEPSYVINQRLQQTADLLIIGWLPQTHWTHAVHGQLAEQFIKHANCDLIVVK